MIISLETEIVLVYYLVVYRIKLRYIGRQDSDGGFHLLGV